jgi:hypothetical protein
MKGLLVTFLCLSAGLSQAMTVTVGATLEAPSFCSVCVWYNDPDRPFVQRPDLGPGVWQVVHDPITHDFAFEDADGDQVLASHELVAIDGRGVTRVTDPLPPPEGDDTPAWSVGSVVYAFDAGFWSDFVAVQGQWRLSPQTPDVVHVDWWIVYLQRQDDRLARAFTRFFLHTDTMRHRVSYDDSGGGDFWNDAARFHSTPLPGAGTLLLTVVLALPLAFRRRIRRRIAA